MFDVGVSPFSEFLSGLAGAIKEAGESSHITLQKAFRGDRVAMRKVEQQEEQSRLQDRLLHRSPNPAVGQTLDILA
jgi:hypothetical protein